MLKVVVNVGLIAREDTVLVVVDVQAKLFPHISGKAQLARKIVTLIRFAEIAKIPIVLTEQYSKGLGPTIPEVKQLLPNIQPIEKVEFSCFGSEKFVEVLKGLKAKTLVILGIETHICVAQTVIDGLERGYKIYVVADAVSSRDLEDKGIGLERMRQSGALIVSTEMIIYELLKKAGTPEFKEALKLVK